MQLNFVFIRQLRTEKGWTQQHLADICAVSLRTIQRVEVHGIASLETSKALAAAFEVNRESLLGEEELTVTDTRKKPVPLWLLVVTFLAGVLCGAFFLSLLR
ncbi:MAG: helix-turn-helix transcriptional regulator [Gammaproteobacteria bacterium]|nr:helix-turn-helix transcriptional regulator [Gammaproteobacteria bacterium]MBU2056436.1 helix-turn-helix transcriptional regulator [Gammaproteobacteria bacterium]MBU2175492.1 helix-turn-helix transcriptional regulator [Gammaproteobacteria bacterium]MBU2246647.1 helix-turn-helix transcriptional regulator [Gammaproteobacteria bacterium]MBU2345889.1 helix-turn-helix transcriptional regulator [Gammaproteobacteria bacterium]